MSNIRDTLDEREKRYGSFVDHAGLAEQLIRIAQFNHSDLAQHQRERYGWLRMSPMQRHAVRYILDKVARVINGDSHHTDSWHDIAGYATLIEDRLNETKRTQSELCSCGSTMEDVHAPDCGVFANPADTRRSPRS